MLKLSRAGESFFLLCVLYQRDDYNKNHQQQHRACGDDNNWRHGRTSDLTGHEDATARALRAFVRNQIKRMAKRFTNIH